LAQPEPESKLMPAITRTIRYGTGFKKRMRLQT
jgi:hypothetical protein